VDPPTYASVRTHGDLKSTIAHNGQAVRPTRAGRAASDSPCDGAVSRPIDNSHVPVPGYRDAPSPPWQPETPADLAEAEEFLRQVYADRPGSVEPRLAAVRAQIALTGTYTHTPEELTYGARLAWRNASRCIGRLYWQSLLVRDRRHVHTADAIFEEVVAHLRIAGDRNRRGIRPVITVFPPVTPGRPFARLWNEQLVRYAGYRQADGSVVGDPRYTAFTEAVQELGWRGKDDRFDVLPLVVQTPEEGVRLYDLPDSAVWEVPLAHPELPWFAELGLRWHAVPAISNMRLSIGGIDYPLAPFNGWYLGTEIGVRNLADVDRYNLLPAVAARLGLDITTERTLWRDRALVELNRAVLWSFDRAGARISDHHSESRRFLDHIAREERAGRPVPADWTWIVPPMSGATTPVFHRYYPELDLRPNFYLDEDAVALAHTGRPAAPCRHLWTEPHNPPARHEPARHEPSRHAHHPAHPGHPHPPVHAPAHPPVHAPAHPPVHAPAHPPVHAPAHAAAHGQAPVRHAVTIRRVPAPRLPLRPACPPSVPA
jgi:nitric-oxide synthase, bacterial